MKIKKGYNSKKTIIKVGGVSDRHAEFWIEQTGLSEKDTLSYISLEELLDLKDEIDVAILEITRLNK